MALFLFPDTESLIFNDQAYCQHSLSNEIEHVGNQLHYMMFETSLRHGRVMIFC